MKIRQIPSLGQAAFSLLEIVVAAAALGGLSLLVYQLGGFVGKIDSESGVKTAIEAIRSEIVLYANNDKAWKKTVETPSNPSFACIRGQASCTDALSPFKLLDGGADNKAIYDALYASAGMKMGYTIEGKPCNEFDDANGSNRCPLRLDLAWRPICNAAAATCVNPSFLIKGSFRYRPKDPTAMPVIQNIATYDFELRRSQFYTNDECTMFGGTRLADGTCSKKFVKGQCPDCPQQLITGVAQDGNVACAPTALPPMLPCTSGVPVPIGYASPNGLLRVQAVKWPGRDPATGLTDSNFFTIRINYGGGTGPGNVAAVQILRSDTPNATTSVAAPSVSDNNQCFNGGAPSIASDPLMLINGTGNTDLQVRMDRSNPGGYVVRVKRASCWQMCRQRGCPRPLCSGCGGDSIEAGSSICRPIRIACP